MRRLTSLSLAALAVAFAPSLATFAGGGLRLAPAAAAADQGRSARLLAMALDKLRAGDIPGARAAGEAAGPLAAAIVDWSLLRDGNGNFGATTAFLGRHPDWPGLALIRRKGEAAIPEGADPARVIAYFAEAAPATGEGALALAAAWRARGDMARAEAEALRAWRELSLSEAEQTALVAAFPAAVATGHAARLENLLWAERLTEAQRMLPLVSADRRALAQARILLRRDQDGVDAAIAAVPAVLADDAGLAWERFAWRMRKSRYDEAAAFLDARSTSAEALGRPAVWAERRALLARREMRQGDPARAWRLAAHHFLTQGSDYADLEWLAGYIALRKLDDPARALAHFDAMAQAVGAPISLGRAGYWQGRALEALGRPDEARAAYARGAQHQTGFYGQLAAERLGQPLDPALAGMGAPVRDWRAQGFAQGEPFQAGLLLREAGEGELSRRFLTHLAEGLDAAGLAALSDYALQADDPHLALLVAKQAAARGVLLPRAYFPVMGLARMESPVAPEFAMAIARRESEFNPVVVSSAGARGLMQVMPGTARQMATKLGLPYTPDRLTADWRYNARMGTAYLAHLEEEFGASVALVAAGYNAGPGRPREWIAAFGDPRARNVDVVDWIEHIPFTETRNYVMRVAESIPIYRARLTGGAEPIRLTEALKAR